MLDPDGGKKCTKCSKFLRTSHFYKDKRRKDGLQSACKGCRRASYDQAPYDYEQLALLRGTLGDLAAEQSVRRDRSDLRALAVGAANNELHRREIVHIAKTYFRDKVVPRAYALSRPRKKAKRTVSLLLSDLHIGANLLSTEEPAAFGPIQEARRLEYVIRQAADYKPQYRDHSDLLVLLNGDIIEGDLGHEKRSGERLAWQKLTAVHLLQQAIGYLATAYPRVRVVCQPGNHGRDIARHKDRATTAKWDGHEWEIYHFLRMSCGALQNVSWDITRKAYSIVDVHGHKLLLTHGDTEIKLGNPFSKGDANLAEIHKINSTLLYGCVFDIACFGHFHVGLVQHAIPTTLLWNGALIPPNAWARTKGYSGYPTGQYLFESVEGHPFGDSRFLQVGPAQDNDNKLGEIITPCRAAA